MRQLPAPLAGSYLRHGLLMHCAELVEEWRQWVPSPGSGEGPLSGAEVGLRESGKGQKA